MGKLTQDMVTELAISAGGGDRKAFDLLRSEYGDAIRGYLMVKAPVKPSQVDLDDLEQLVWLRVYETIGSFDPTIGNFDQFVIGTVAKWIAMRWNQRRREEFIEEREEYLQDRMLMDESADPATAYEEHLAAGARLEAFRLLTRVLFLCGGYPHQQLVFAFLKVIYSTGQKAQGSAAKVVDTHGSTCMEELAKDFVRAYQRESALPPSEMAFVAKALAPTVERLALELVELMSGDKASLASAGKLAASKVADTSLCDYYSGHKQAPTAAVSDWSYGVQRRIVSVLSGLEPEDEHTPDAGVGSLAGACKRCKLRLVDPCARETDPSARIAVGHAAAEVVKELLS